MYNRGFSSTTNYRYGFNGKENDNEVKGNGNQQDYGKRIYDPRLGRFLSVDPIAMQYPQLSTYQFASNRPIAGTDIDGLEFNGAYTAGMVFTQIQVSVAEKDIKNGVDVNTAMMHGLYVSIMPVKVLAIICTVITQPEVGIPWALADITGAPVTPSPQAWASVATSVISSSTTSEMEASFGSKALGEMGEEALAKQYGTEKPTGMGSSMKTSMGARKPDGIPAGTTVQATDVYYESKVGFTKYTGNVVKQVAKDAELLKQGQVKEITWVFYKNPVTGKVGASSDLLKALKDAGIKTQIAGEIPKDIVKKIATKYEGSH